MRDITVCVFVCGIVCPFSRPPMSRRIYITITIEA